MPCFINTRMETDGNHMIISKNGRAKFYKAAKIKKHLADCIRCYEFPQGVSVFLRVF